MNVSLQELRALSDSLHTTPDDRPQWLKGMPYSSETKSHYHILLWEICRRYKPEYTIEIGIDKAGSTLALAAGNPAGAVISVDIDKPSCENAKKVALSHSLVNLTVAENDSLKHCRELLQGIDRKADLLFIDGAHDFKHAFAEYVEYRPLMKQGAIILFDDIHESKDMEAVWDKIVDPKVELPKAHWTGFGACKVDFSISAPTFAGIGR